MQEREFEVYTRTSWENSWHKRSDIEPLRCSQAISPGIGQAQFRLRLGDGQNPDGSRLDSANNPASLQRVYIRVEEVGGNNVFCGWIPKSQFDVLGESNGVKTADHIIHAQTFDTFLDSAIDGGWVEDSGSARAISCLPVFNERSENGLALLGNMSSSTVSVDGASSFVFSDDGEVWSYWHILDYLFVRSQPAGGPDFRLNGSSGVWDMLANVKTVVDLNGDTFRSALNKLIPRSRGLFWTLFYDASSNYVQVYVDSKLDAELTVGTTVIPANARQRSVDLWGELKDEKVRVTQNAQNHYDKIIVRGQKIKSCFTVSIADGNLEKAWTDELETKYKTAADGSDGFSDLSPEDQRRANDEFRATDEFERVFSHFRIPNDWDWTVQNGSSSAISTHLTLNDEGSVASEFNLPWNSQKRLQPQLPLAVGVDYSIEGRDDSNPDNSQSEFRKAFVICENANERYVYLDKVPFCPANIRMLSREMAFDVSFNPQYLFAAGKTAGFEAGTFAADSIDSHGYNYDKLKATVCMETDNYLQVVWDNSAGVENPRTLIVDVPDAQMWAIAPNTTVGINPDGSEQKFTGNNFIRNDVDRLLEIRAAVVAQLAKSRNQLEITINDTASPWLEGDMLNDVAVATGSVPAIAGTVVTSYAIDFIAGKTTIRTDFAELDYQSIFASEGTATIPTLKAASREITRQKKEIKKLKEDSGNAVLRQSAQGGTLQVVRDMVVDHLDGDRIAYKITPTSSVKFAQCYTYPEGTPVSECLPNLEIDDTFPVIEGEYETKCLLTFIATAVVE